MTKYALKTKTRLLSLLLSAAIPSIAFAQSGPSDEAKVAPTAASTVSTVTVTARRNDALVTTVAKEQEAYGTDVQVISGARVEQSGALNFAEALQFLVKGVNIGYSPDEGEYTIRLDGGGDR